MSFPEGVDKHMYLGANTIHALNSEQMEVQQAPDTARMLRRESEDHLGRLQQSRKAKSKIATEQPDSENYGFSSGYLAFKNRKVEQDIKQQLERVFNEECRPLGDFVYPPGGYRTWHTNRHDMGKHRESVWAIFLVYTHQENQSFFRFIDPKSGEMITVWDKKVCANLFRVHRKELFWHCISAENTMRWSIGFEIPDNWQEALDFSQEPPGQER